VYVVWGSTYLAIRVAVETMPPMLSAGARFITGGLILGLICALRGRRLRVTRRELTACALIGLLLLAGGNGLVVFAQAGGAGAPVPSGVAALLIAVVPLILVILRAATGDRPKLWTVVGVIIGFTGLAALVLARGGTGAVPVLGALTVLGGAASWAVGSFASRRVPLPADPFVSTVYQGLFGGAGLLLVGALRAERVDLAQVSTRSWLALAFLITAGSLAALTAYVWLLQNAPISLVSTYAYVNPAVAVLLGALLVDESVTGQIIAGGLIIVVGVALVVSTERPKRPAPAPEPDPLPAGERSKP